MSVFDSLLNGLDDGTQRRTRELITESVTADREGVLAGLNPERRVDTGGRERRRRSAGTSDSE
ncbi:hypothetical protein [Pseudofrankia asymbiotica]|uniref:Uncharacterized protein n=1 Tax=Pseudofrankia asymbiotica TaxID=1834516 RepID=A0A1V2I656_9ACTN|nr:hypothetical protein [Pseudofrankia asymbiotica]ONH25363.1 hypothetical protein BL253_27505 [Pseudofrankia asymbiotica]